MTRTDVMASSRPRAQGVARSSRASSSVFRRLIVLSVMSLLTAALVAPVGAVAAGTTSTNKEGLSGYEKKPEEKTTTTPPTTTTNKEGLSGYEKKPEEKKGTSPSKESSTGTTPTSTTPTSTTPTSTTPTSTTPETTPTPTSSVSPASEKAASGTLPFTGFDLRWMVGMGLLLVGAGVSIVTMQRRHRRDSS